MQLQMLVAIAERGTLMAAAETLNVSQPAVTKSIKELEMRLGVQLLERSGAGVRLTRYGEALLRRARTVVAEIARAERELEEEIRRGAHAVNRCLAAGFVDCYAGRVARLSQAAARRQAERV